MEAGNVTDDSSMEAKKLAVFKRLAKRNEARVLAQGDSVRVGTKAAADEFNSAFEKLKTEFKCVVESARDLSPEEVSSASVKIEEASGLLQDMQKLLNGKVAGLPPYFVQQLQSELDQYYGEVTKLRQSRMPKKRFGFKKPSGGLRQAKPSVVEKKPVSDTVPRIVSANEVNISHQSDVSKELSAVDVMGKDVQLSYLRNCVVRLEGTPSTLHLTHVENCKIFTGPVRTSIFVESCSNTEFQIACQQLRIHSSHDCRFFTFVASRAIIEDCKTVEFAPYGWSYTGIEDDFGACGFSMEKNNWKSVDDFNWLALDKPSPNWRVIEDHDRLEKSH